MSGSNRGIYIAAGIGLLFAFVIGLPLFLEASRLQAFYEQQASERAQYNRDSTRSRALQRCSSVTTEEVTSCVYQEYDRAHQAEREAYDLQAQLVTSAWTRAMGIAAIVGMAVGIFGVSLIYKTFEETRRTADEAKNANAIADNARRATERQLRAYISVTDLVSVDLAGANPRFQMVVANKGQTPAHDVLMHAVVMWNANPDPNSIKIRFIAQPHRVGTMAAGASFTMDSEESLLEPAIREGVQNGTHNVVFASLIRYRDILASDVSP